MEELKILVSMIKDLPQMTLWIIAFFFVYKVCIIGSVYGVIRLAIQRFYEYGISENAKSKTTIIKQEIHFEDLLNGITISGEHVKFNLIKLLKYFAGNNTNYSGNYIHDSHVDWLRDAIDSKNEKDIADGKKIR